MKQKYNNLTDWAEDIQSVFLDKNLWYNIGNEISLNMLFELKSSKDKYIPWLTGALTNSTRLRKMRVTNELITLTMISKTTYARKQYYTNPRGKQLWFEIVEVGTRESNLKIISKMLDEAFE